MSNYPPRLWKRDQRLATFLFWIVISTWTGAAFWAGVAWMWLMP